MYGFPVAFSAVLSSGSAFTSPLRIFCAYSAPFAALFQACGSVTVLPSSSRVCVCTPRDATTSWPLNPEAFTRRSSHPSSPRPLTTTTSALLSAALSFGEGSKVCGSPSGPTSVVTFTWSPPTSRVISPRMEKLVTTLSVFAITVCDIIPSASATTNPVRFIVSPCVKKAHAGCQPVCCACQIKWK